MRARACPSAHCNIEVDGNSSGPDSSPEWFRRRVATILAEKPRRAAAAEVVAEPSQYLPTGLISPNEHRFVLECAARHIGSDEIRVLECLGEGRSAALTNAELAERAGITDDAAGKAIEVLRLNGVIVCTRTEQPPGCFLAANLDESQASTSALIRRALRHLAVARTQERAHQRQFDQLPKLRELGAMSR